MFCMALHALWFNCLCMARYITIVTEHSLQVQIPLNSEID
jgi:hypothetical protein